MAKQLYILTGASRGLGAAMAEQILQTGAQLLTISRHINKALVAQADASPSRLEQWALDLADPQPVASLLEDWLRTQDPSAFEAAALINNAAALTRVGPVDQGSVAETSAALRVGLEAAVTLTSVFLGATRGWRARAAGHCKVLNISSGLGRFAMAGSAVYCAAKAGIDNFSRAVALDEANRGHAARIVALAPGVIETDMQAQMRAADGPGFPDRELFLRLHASGQLTSPQEAAGRVLAYLGHEDFGSTAVAELKP
jgi:NAD(P)-dependent dehydrogenase (short-subunit alcohol dehydrogenase family)